MWFVLWSFLIACGGGLTAEAIARGDAPASFFFGAITAALTVNVMRDQVARLVRQR